VIGKTGKDIPKDKAIDYILGYTAGNDLTARKWQRDPAFAGGAPQWCFAKGFDKFAPVGPSLVSPSLVGAADNLALKTVVNGEVRQDSNTADLIFGVRDIVAFISQGTTLEKGTVIMTGSPAGVAMAMTTPKWLNHGDEVEVIIDEIGTLQNHIVFE
jgi:2-keto-4-pentenoate hydratase/2-oxohepta-3-ene-1,7-dioic acid hydratase in catechol pathway